METALQVSLSEGDVMRVAQAVVDLLVPKLAQTPALGPVLPAVMKRKAVLTATNLGKTRLLGLMETGDFPLPFEGGGRGSTMLWRGADVQQWINTHRGRSK